MEAVNSEAETIVKMCLESLIKRLRLRLFAAYSNFEDEENHCLTKLEERKQSCVKDYDGLEGRCHDNVGYYEGSLQSDENDLEHVCYGNERSRRESQCSVYAICNFDHQFYYINGIDLEDDPEQEGQCQRVENQRLVQISKYSS